ncbi:hypothetical protein SAE01_37490 [Segetibacter aerophilus]|uniref:Uncharacterized protein n=2 Tax=Segetibacter aerophilus TaxID=670293 RepID=A0A512BH18_9BACT|nr:hypothetical protein SAE01_37490 [Segetibacter aerophilus]
MAYKLKSGPGAYIGVATTKQAVDFSFADPLHAATAYTAAAKNLQLRLEGGYQFTSKAIALRKPVNTKSFASKYAGRTTSETARRCTRSSSISRCGGMRNSANTAAASLSKITPKDEGLFLRIQPSVGLAYAPIGGGIETTTKNGSTNYTYRAGSTTALVAGTAFEFGTKTQTKFIVSVNYLQGLGNNTQTVTSNEMLKPTTTTFSSKTSGFNVSLGIPIVFKKKPAVIAAPPIINRSSHHGRCGQYRSYQL